MRGVLFSVFITIGFALQAQNIDAFIDFRDRFFIFDTGQLSQQDFLKPVSFKASQNYLAFIKYNNDFMIYADGKVVKFKDAVSDYVPTDYLMAIENFKALSVYDNGKLTSLTPEASKYAIGDSVIAFFDNYQKIFKIYYQGEVLEIESGLLDKPMSDFKVGENIVAYVNNQDYFKMFYQGETIQLYNTGGTSPLYNLGRNVLAYFDEPSSMFMAIVNNEEFEVEDFAPESFVCGDNMVVYVNPSGEFNVFKDGETQEISSFAPTFYNVIDDMIVYGVQGYLYVYQNGESTELENYIPQTLLIDKGIAVYIDQQGRLISFHDGEKEIVSSENISRFNLYGNVIAYQIGANQNFFRWQGKDYKTGS